MSSSNAKSVIESAIGASNVSEDVSAYAVDGIEPSVVALPSSIDELSKLMTAAHDVGLAVAPWGGGTRMSIGNTPSRLDVVADVSRLNRVVQHTAADLTATFEAGVTLSEAQKVLAEAGQFLAIDPPLPEKATIGGTLASGASGPLKWQFGHPRDTVIGMKIVQPDGTITKSGGQVVKNVSGYDMARLHIGGLGTLGIIAEVSFKLTPKPRKEATLVAAFDNVEDCLKAALAIFESHVLPLSLTAFDEEVHAKSGVELPGGGYSLGIRLGGRPRTVERQVNECIRICKESGAAGVENLDGDGANTLWRQLSDFGWSESTTPVLAARISAMPSQIANLSSKIQGASGGLRSAIISHPAYGGVMINWFGDDGDVDSALRQTLDAVQEIGARIVIERCPTRFKNGLDVWGEQGEPLAIIKRMKEQYDPDGILNPGRFAGRI